MYCFHKLSISTYFLCFNYFVTLFYPCCKYFLSLCLYVYIYDRQEHLYRICVHGFVNKYEINISNKSAFKSLSMHMSHYFSPFSLIHQLIFFNETEDIIYQMFKNMTLIYIYSTIYRFCSSVDTITIPKTTNNS